MSVGSVNIDLLPISTVEENKFIVGVETGVTGQRFRTKDVQSANTLKAPIRGGFGNVTTAQKEMHTNAFVARADGYHMTNRVDGRYLNARSVGPFPDSTYLFESGSSRHLFTSRNGSLYEDGGKFLHNSSTYGGSKASLEPVVEELKAKQGELHAASITGAGAYNPRYGPEYHINKITVGSGTSGLGAIAAAPDSVKIAYVGGMTSPMYSFGWWMKGVAGKTAISSNFLSIDGASQSGSQHIMQDDDWHYYLVSGLSSYLGYSNHSPIFSEVGDEVYTALESLFTGYVHPETIFIHPVPQETNLL